MSVARAREVMARLRAAGITVHEWPGWESRGNGYTSNYEGIIVHHTATPFGYAFQALVSGRPDLSGPLCNTAGNVDGSVTMIAAHPANHAGAGSGPSLGPLPRTTLFNPRVWGHEIVYPGTVPMTNAQYRTAQILSRICVDVFGYGDIERARLHAETNGRGFEGKWDAGNGNGTTYDAVAFRRGAATLTEEDDMAGEGPEILAMLRNLNNWMLHGGPGPDALYAGKSTPGLSPTSAVAVIHDTNRALRERMGPAIVELLKRGVADVDESALADELAKRGVGQVDPAVIKAAVSEVLRKGTDSA